MFVDQKHLLRQSPSLTLRSLMTSLQPRAKANFGICAPGRIVSADFAIIAVSVLIVTSSQIYFCLYHIHKTFFQEETLIQNVYMRIFKNC